MIPFARLLFCTILGGLAFLPGIALYPAACRAADDSPDIDTLVSLLELVLDADSDSARKCLGLVADKVQSRELAGKSLEALRPRLDKLLSPILDGKADQPLYADAVATLATLGNPRGLTILRATAVDFQQSDDARQRAVETLAFAGDRKLLESLPQWLVDRSSGSVELRAAFLAALSRWDEPRLGAIVLAQYAKLEQELQPRAIELLTQRPVWAKELLQAVGRKEIPTSAINANQIARLQSSRDAELAALVLRQWGTVRTERNPAREKVIADVRRLLTEKSGDPHQGHKVFTRVCGQCHKIHGTGQDVGPDITLNGRSSFEQLLSNVLDPSLVIGASYQARTVVTSDGRVLTGLLSEDNAQRVVLKMQGGKLETVARDDVEELRVSQLSMMPEGLETQLNPDEMVDLFAFLVLDKPPIDPSARRIPTSQEAAPSSSSR